MWDGPCAHNRCSRIRIPWKVYGRLAVPPGFPRRYGNRRQRGEATERADFARTELGAGIPHPGPCAFSHRAGARVRRRLRDARCSRVVAGQAGAVACPRLQRGPVRSLAAEPSRRLGSRCRCGRTRTGRRRAHSEAIAPPADSLGSGRGQRASRRAVFPARRARPRDGYLPGLRLRRQATGAGVHSRRCLDSW